MTADLKTVHLTVFRTINSTCHTCIYICIDKLTDVEGLAMVHIGWESGGELIKDSITACADDCGYYYKNKVTYDGTDDARTLTLPVAC